MKDARSHERDELSELTRAHEAVDRNIMRIVNTHLAHTTYAVVISLVNYNVPEFRTIQSTVDLVLTWSIMSCSHQICLIGCSAVNSSDCHIRYDSRRQRNSETQIGQPLARFIK